MSTTVNQTLVVSTGETLAVNSELNNGGTVENAGTVALTGGLSQAGQTAATTTVRASQSAVTAGGETTEAESTAIAAVALPDSRQAVTVLRLTGEFDPRHLIQGET